MKTIYSYLLMIWLTLSFTISSAQTPTITTTGVYSCTSNGTAELTLPSGYAIYEWYNASSVLVASTQTYVAAPGTYTAKVKQTIGGSYISVNAFTVTQIVPTAPTITPPSDVLTAICGTSSRSIVASGATNYDWKRDGTSLVITTSTLSVDGTSVTTAGTYSYTVSTTNSTTGCTSTSTAVSLKVSPKPTTPVITAISNNLLCGTETKTLTATSGSTSYSWKRGSTALSSTVNTLLVSATDVVSSGTYNFTVVGTNSVGCVSDTSAKVALVLSSKPTTPVISPVSPTLLCGVDTKTLTATSGGTSYIWKRDATLLSSTTNTLAVTGTDVSVAGTYNYKVVLQNSFGCSSDTSLAISLKVSPKPTTPVITAVSNNLLCGTETKTLTATSGSTSYSWKRGSTALSSTVNTLLVSATDVVSSGTYNFTVVGTNSVGCVSDTSAKVALVLSSKPTTPVISPVSPTLLCGVDTKTLTATSGGTSYIWKRDATLLSSTTNTLAVTGTDVSVAGTYNFKVVLQNSFGCSSDTSLAISLKVSPKPTTPVITAVSNNLLCGTQTKTLTATSGNAIYSWKRDTTTLSSKVNTLLVSATDVVSSGTYNFTVVGTNSVGCVSDTSAKVALVLSTNPAKPAITAGGVTTFCDGGSVVLNSSYTSSKNVWSRINGADVETTTTQGITVTASNTFTVKAKNTFGCLSVSSDSLIVTVNPNPAPPVILQGTTVSICDLDSIILNSNDKGSGLYSWSNGKNTKSITVNSAGNYSLTYTDANTCKSAPSLITVLTVNPLPAKPTITASRPIEFCAGDFTTLKSSLASGYIWSNGQTSSQIDVNVSAIISVKVLSDKGCRSKDASDPITIIANPLPDTPIVLANGPLIFCPDSTVTLSSSVVGNEYIWTNVASNSVFNKTQSVVISAAGEFAVQAISIKKCVSKISKSVKVNVREAPQPASILASPIATFCKGGNTTLKALIANGNVEKYSWRNEDTQKEISTLPAITTDTSGRYSVKVRDTFGCFSAYSKVLKVTVNPLPTKPTLRIVRPKIFCDGDSTLLESSLPSTTPNGTKNIYQWTVDGVAVNNSNGRLFSWNKANSIGVSLVDTNGCKSVSASDTIKITVNQLPQSPSIIIKGSNPFCADKSVSLTAIGVQVNSYQWSVSSSTSNTISVNTAGSVTVRAVSAFNCLSKPSQPVTLSIYPLPVAPQISNTSATTFCDGDNVFLASSGINKVYWYRNTNDSLGNTNNNIISISKSGSYYARAQDNNSCMSFPSNPITVDVRSLPTLPVISQVGTFILEANSNGDDNGYIWKYNGEEQKSFLTKSIKVKKDGDYQVQSSIVYNQVALPTGKLVCISKPSLVYKYKQDLNFEGMSVYPNPSTTGEIAIEVIEELVGSELTVYTLEGKFVQSIKIDKFIAPQKINLSGSPSNTYLIRLATDSFERIKKVIVLK